ncbi:MAG TPA: DDE-type integrase/transposase/recombinase, partial [Dehalococcoidales bacterium]|nr:DDE-type integrase/transposase/recombinase [Dehalococcoidales bacterium]
MEGPIIPHTGLARRAGAPCCAHGFARMSSQNSDRRLPAHPDVITMDNGPEFVGRALDEWAYRKGVKLNFIRPGKPIENAFAESFNG